jgi:hypothetical protein
MISREQISSAAWAVPGRAVAVEINARTNAFGFMFSLDYSIG